MVVPFSEIWVGFCLNTGKCFFLEAFLKKAERAQVLLKSGTRDFQNSPLFDRSTCFYVTVIKNFECFQHLNSETDFLENENLFFSLEHFEAGKCKDKKNKNDE